MASEDTFDMANSGKRWTTEQDELLVKQYKDDELSVLEIARAQKRLPGGIISRLKGHKLIKVEEDARGYEEAKNDPKVKEAIISKKQTTTTTTTTTSDGEVVTTETKAKKILIDSTMLQEMKDELKTLRAENRTLQMRIIDLQREQINILMNSQKN